MAGQDVAAQRQLFVDGQRRQPQHALRHRNVEIRAASRRRPPRQRRGDGQRRVHAAGRGIGYRGARQRRRAAAPGVLMAR